MNVHCGLAKIALFLSAGFPLANAAQVIITASGTVSQGTDGTTWVATDGTPPGAAKVFKGGATLDKLPFTLTITLDDSLQNSNFYSCPDGSVYTSNSSATSGVTATLRIGAGAYAFGALPMSGLPFWEIYRSAPTSCANEYSSMSFAFSECYGGDYGGCSGLGWASFYAESPFSSGDFRSFASSSVTGSPAFYFYIAEYENGKLSKYANGYLSPEKLTVSGPLSCPAGTLAPPAAADGTPHSYVVKHPICSTAFPSCTPENVFAVLRRFPTDPFPDVNPINTCDPTNIPGVGPVVSYVDSSDLSIVNVTLPNHTFYPGQVIRSVITESGEIYIQTTGGGTGPWPWFNENAADIYWAIPDGLITSYFRIRDRRE